MTKPNQPDCLSQIHICKGSCCKKLSFKVKGLTPSKKYYYEVHGCTVLHLGEDKWDVHIPIVCPQLNEKNLCGLHGTDKKPDLCTALNDVTAHSGMFIITEGCVYEEKK